MYRLYRAVSAARNSEQRAGPASGETGERRDDQPKCDKPPEASEDDAAYRVAGVPLYAITNWSAETYPIAHARFPILTVFRGLVVSGHIGLAKPDAAIFHHAAKEFGHPPAECLFIDDAPANVTGAQTPRCRVIPVVPEATCPAGACCSNRSGACIRTAS